MSSYQSVDPRKDFHCQRTGTPPVRRAKRNELRGKLPSRSIAAPGRRVMSECPNVSRLIANACCARCTLRRCRVCDPANQNRRAVLESRQRSLSVAVSTSGSQRPSLKVRMTMLVSESGRPSCRTEAKRSERFIYRPDATDSWCAIARVRHDRKCASGATSRW